MFLRTTIFLLWLFPLALRSVSPPPFPLPHLAIREAFPLSEWQFQAVPPGQEDDTDWSGPDSAAARAAWPNIRIPAVWNQPPGAVRAPVPAQVAWFRCVVPLPKTWDGDVALCFLGVQFSVDVFVNGEFISLHRGGYTPFLVSLPAASPRPETLEILLRVDNRLSENTIPKAGAGWEMYGGLTREAYLLHQPPQRPENLFVIPRKITETEWVLQVQATLRGPFTSPLHIQILDGANLLSESVVDSPGETLDIEVPVLSPKLWSPDSPHLYTLEMTWGKERLRIPVGFREIRFEKGRLLLNGEPLWLQGFGQHEFYPDSGPILSHEQRRQDFLRMKQDFAANAFRTGHYPNHPDIYHLADELGFLVFTEIPAWQSEPRVLATDEAWQNWLEPQLTDMVLNFRNHPSVFAWGVLNEIDGAHAYVRRAVKHIRDLDPTRPVSAVIAKDEDFHLNRITDLAARNLHYGWYHSRNVYDLREGLRANLEAAGSTPLWISELGGMARPGRLGGGYSDEVRGTETYQDKMTRFGLQYSLFNADRIVGLSLWTWSDYERGGRPHDHGILGPDRAPKLAAYATVNLMRPDTVVLALENETLIPAGGEFTAELAVFSRKPAPGERYTLHADIRRGAEILLRQEHPLTLGEEHVTPAGNISWPLPEGIPPGLHHLYVELRRGDELIHSQALPFEPGETTRPGVLRLPPPKNDAVQRVEINGMKLMVYPHVGLHLALPPGRHELRSATGLQTLDIQAARSLSVEWE
jgi:beta-glucuronidase